MPLRQLSDKQRAFVSAYLGEANHNATRAAQLAGYSKARQSGSENLSNPVVQDAINQWRQQAKTEAITQQRYRLARIADLEQRYLMLLEERAIAYGDAPGGKSGLLVRTTKVTPTADGGVEITHEYKADTAVTKEIRELLKQAAIEVGEWAEGRNVNVKVDVLVQEMAAKYGVDPVALAAALEDEE